MTSEATHSEALAPLRDSPEETAIVLDVDGTLAPIVARPELAAVPPETQAILRLLSGRYLLVACLSGRAGQDARRLVGVEEVVVVGNHGLELDPRAAELASEIARFRDSVAWPVEDKELSLSYHYREAEDEVAAVAALEQVAERSRKAGLIPRWGRKVLEIRPPIAVDKGTAVRTLIEQASAQRGLYAGDDTTDLDAFAGLRSAGLQYSVTVAVRSTEGPPGLQEQADLVVPDPAALRALLALL